MDPELDEELDRRISDLLAGNGRSRTGAGEKELGPYEDLAAQVARVMTEESPRPSTAAQVRNLAFLRARAAEKRAARHFDIAWFLHAAPRWVQIAAVAIVVVITANGITVASASSLPGSPLYSVKRLAEQSNVFLAPTAGERARIWMNLASRRLDEVQRLVALEPRVDPGTLDAIDESILHALTEIAGTRGTERIALLQQIVELSVREQNVLDELSLEASVDDRVRFQQTVRLMANVANFADAAQSNPQLPPSTPTSTETTSPYEGVGRPTATSPSSPKVTPIPPSETPSPTLEPSATPTLQVPSSTPGLSGDQQTKGEPSDTPGADNGKNAQPQKTEAPDQGNGDTPQAHKTESPDPEKTDSPDREKTNAPQPQKTQPSDQ